MSKTASKWVDKTKVFRFSGLKVSPSTPNAAQLEKINRFTRRPFTADELYIGQLRLANNCIDRDNERFSEGTLQGFADTVVRKTLLMDHNKRDSQDAATGKFFDVEMEKVPLAQAIAETGEDLRLPVGMTDVVFLSPWFYIPKAGIDEKQLVKIEAGIFDFCSIGFRAEAWVPVADDMGNNLFYEYRGKGETTEGSLVYLGAQYGAAVKSPGTDNDDVKTIEHDEENNQGGTSTMNEMLMKLAKAFGKVFSENVDAAVAEIKALFDGKDAEIAIHKTEIEAQKTKVSDLEKRIGELAPQAEDGKAYRDDLVGRYVTSKAKLGEVAETPEAQGKVKAVAALYPIDFLKLEVDVLDKRVAEKFPDHPQTKGDERRDKSEDGGKNKSFEEGSKNPIVPEE